MNKNDRAILIGLAIGDGYISLPRGSGRKSCQFVLTHSTKQIEYIEYKAELIHSIIGGKKPRVIHINNNGYPGVTISKCNKYFGLLRIRLYKNGKKNISRKILDMMTPQSIAIWYMDDGNLSMKKRNGKIHARELFLNTHISVEENQVIIDYFKEVHGINFTQVKNRGNYRLRCGTAEAKKFIALVEKFIIPSMHYKIDMHY